MALKGWGVRGDSSIYFEGGIGSKFKLFTTNREIQTKLKKLIGGYVGSFLVQDIPPPSFSIFAQSIRQNSRVNLDRFCPLIVGLPIPSLVEYAQIIAQNSKSWASSSSCRFQGKYKDNLHHPPDSHERS